jgi:hypothetical protein
MALGNFVFERLILYVPSRLLAPIPKAIINPYMLLHCRGH